MNKYLSMALEVAMNSKCLRRKYGAVLVKNDMVISVGYNGAARGVDHCESCKRVGMPHNAGYAGDCPAVHAEANCLIQDNAQDAVGATLYLAGWEVLDNGMLKAIDNPQPCVECAKMIRNAQIAKVYSKD